MGQERRTPGPDAGVQVRRQIVGTDDNDSRRAGSGEDAFDVRNATRGLDHCPEFDLATPKRFSERGEIVGLIGLRQQQRIGRRGTQGRDVVAPPVRRKTVDAHDTFSPAEFAVA